MYAIVEIGNQQYRVSERDEIEVEKLNREIGQKIEFKNVLLVSDETKVAIGQPALREVKVIGEVVRHGQGRKVIAFKYRKRENYKRKQGHRQPFTRIRILEINQSSSIAGLPA